MDHLKACAFLTKVQAQALQFHIHISCFLQNCKKKHSQTILGFRYLKFETHFQVKRYIADHTRINLDPVITRSCGAADAYVWYG